MGGRHFPTTFTIEFSLIHTRAFPMNFTEGMDGSITLKRTFTFTFPIGIAAGASKMRRVASEVGGGGGVQNAWRLRGRRFCHVTWIRHV